MNFFAGTFPDPVNRGSTLTIDVHAPEHAGDTIEVHVLDHEGVDVTLSVALNENGDGAIEWLVPTGTGPSVFIEHPDSDAHVVTVVD